MNGKNDWHYSLACARIVPMDIKRLVFDKLYVEISAPEVSILLGARQTGKTTLMRQIETKAKKSGLSVAFYNLESSADLARLNGNNEEIFRILTSDAEVIFIDEFRYLKNASKIFKEIIDSKKKVKIYASGSSSLEIHKHLKESLAGRFRKTIIHPLTVEELKQIPQKNRESFFKWGGMPGLVHRNTDIDKMDLLENIVSTYITKDIKGIVKEENIRAFNAMMYALAQNQGSLTVVSSIARECGIAESTVASYLDIMSHTYVCHQIASYSTNLANELKKSKKCYLYDIGIRNSLLKDFRSIDKREDKGSIYEGYVLQHLITQIAPNMELRFWRTKKDLEVDFILLINRQPIPIEVKSTLNEAVMPRGMKSFFMAYPHVKRGIVFNETINEQIVINNRTIDFLPHEKASLLIETITE